MSWPPPRFVAPFKKGQPIPSIVVIPTKAIVSVVVEDSNLQFLRTFQRPLPVRAGAALLRLWGGGAPFRREV
jgi:hypothetical protein